jgi:hypothetical protein
MIRCWLLDDWRQWSRWSNQLINQAAHAWLWLYCSHQANDVTEKSKGALINTAG